MRDAALVCCHRQCDQCAVALCVCTRPLGCPGHGRTGRGICFGHIAHALRQRAGVSVDAATAHRQIYPHARTQTEKQQTPHSKQLLKLSAPAALEQAVLQVGFFIFLILIGRFYGTEAFAAYNVGVNMLNIAMVIGMGFLSPIYTRGPTSRRRR